jgi:hypothetical protein
MGMVAPAVAIASTAVVCFGSHGAVTRFAQQRGVSRQRVYRESCAVVTAVDGTAHQQQLEALRQEIVTLGQQLAESERRLAQAVVIDADQQAEFACTAQADGVSLAVARRLLAVFLGPRTPSMAKLGRWTQAAGDKAGALLHVLDAVSATQVRHAVTDEIYVGGRPVLMVVEPESLCWQSGRLAEHADGASWAEELRPLPALEQVTLDAGTGMAKGIQQVNDERQAQQQAPLRDQLDHFHTLREGQRALRHQQARAQRALTKAEEAQRALERAARQGRSQAGLATAAAQAWRRAEHCLDTWTDQERAWQQVQAGLRLFTPEGDLNTRAQANAVLAEAWPRLTGADWAKTKRLLARPETFTYLDRVHEELAAAPVPAELRQAAVRCEGLRRHPELLQKDDPASAARRGVLLVLTSLLACAGPSGAAAVTAVRAILRQAWRASSLVENVNSVVRMQQARHRNLTQGLLDLKRLYWNCRVFAAGRRKDQSPYGRLGVALPSPRWWELIKLTPEQLRQELSARKEAA